MSDDKSAGVTVCSCRGTGGFWVLAETGVMQVAAETAIAEVFDTVMDGRLLGGGAELGTDAVVLQIDDWRHESWAKEAGSEFYVDYPYGWQTLNFAADDAIGDIYEIGRHLQDIVAARGHAVAAAS